MITLVVPGPLKNGVVQKQVVYYTCEDSGVTLSMDMLFKVITAFSSVSEGGCRARAITVMTVLHCVKCFDGRPLCQ